MLPLGRWRGILGKYNIVIVIVSVPEMCRKRIIYTVYIEVLAVQTMS